MKLKATPTSQNLLRKSIKDGEDSGGTPIRHNRRTQKRLHPQNVWKTTRWQCSGLEEV